VFLAVLLSVTVGCAEERLNFNPNWKFLKADAPEAAQPGFDDRSWADISTPHTFNDVDTFANWSLPGHRGEQNQWSGRTWYRKTFTLPASVKGKKVFIEFEAARQVAEVYLNGHYLGVSKSGFTPFGFDLTPELRWDQTNVLAVMCDNRFIKDPYNAESAATPDAEGKDDNLNPNLGRLSAKVNEAIPAELSRLQADQIPWNNPHWHPAHGGIYRNVYLIITDPLHITLPLYSFLQTAGPYVYASDISSNGAQVTVQVPVQNERASKAPLKVRAQVLNRAGQTVLSLEQAAELAPGASGQFQLSGRLANPELWEPSYPALYRVVCSVESEGAVADTCEIPLGVRSVSWSVHEGFSINGHHLKLRGWGQKPTDEWPGLGAAQPDWLHFYTLNLMKEAGANFIRWGHCSAPPASIEASDRLGLLVEEPGVDGESDTRGAAWTLRVMAWRDTLIYYRNHPSILIWEGGNQKVTRDHARELHDLVTQYDPNGGRAYAHRRADKNTAAFMDVGIGTEGCREIASLPVVEGEYDREESPRRVWDDFSPPHFGYPEAKGQTYQLTSEQYAVNQVAQFVRKLGAPDHCGGANWLFSDSTSGGRVTCEVARASGEVDGVRLPKEAYYVCQVLFRSDPQIHIIGHWNYKPGTRKTVYVAANADAVELLLNGNSLGRGQVSDGYLFAFPDVTWQPGELRAVAYRDSKPIASTGIRTAGPAAALRMSLITGPDGLRADGSDVALIDVEAVDAQGNRCPTFEQRVDFETTGPVVWRGGYNSGKTNSINHSFLNLECGINRVAVRSTSRPGMARVQARSQGLAPAELTISSQGPNAAESFSSKLPALPSTPLPAQRPAELSAWDRPVRPATNSSSAQSAGRFTKAFSYSGPTTIVHIEQNAQPGKIAYVDSNVALGELPEQLLGADWVQAANSDSLFHAVDLMELAVPGGTAVWVAHDDGLPRPAWLTQLFKPTEARISVNGRAKTLFQRLIQTDESLTLGPNVEAPGAKPANMYVVFINAQAKPSTRQTSSIRADATGAQISSSAR
jgi:beta-galactosidase